MDMKIPLESFRIPKARSEQLKLIERFETEFGTPYFLDPLIDPSEDINGNGFPIYEPDSIDEKLERIKRRNFWVKKLKDNDPKTVKWCKMLRRHPFSSKNDNGWNIAYQR